MNDELTPDERAALRARIVGGARGITPVGAHRGAWIAGSIAAVLVVAIAGGVVATSTLSAPPQIATTPSPSATVTETATPTPTPSPTPSPSGTPTAVTSVGRAPFDGSCENVLTPDQLSRATGHPMDDVTFVPHDSRATVRGGIFCSWASSDEYKAAMLSIAVLPATEALPMPESASIGPEGCKPNGYCSRTGVADGVQVWVSLKTASEEVTAEQSAVLLDQVLTRAADYGAGIAATPTSQWWSPWDCAQLASGIDPAALSYDTVTSVAYDPGYAVEEGRCSITSSRAESTWEPTAWIVAGGAVGLDEMAAAAYESTSVTVAGAVEAYWVRLESKLDGAAGTELWVSDGTNLLVISAPRPSGPGVAPDYVDSSPDRAILLAEQLLTGL